MEKLEMSILVHADKRSIYELLKASEGYPEFMSDVEEIFILERGPGMQLAEWHAVLDEAPVEWREEERFDDDTMQYWFTGFEGDFDIWQGEWRLEDEADGVRVTMDLGYEFDLPTLQELLMPVIERKIRANVQGMLEGLRDRAEGPPLAAAAQGG